MGAHALVALLATALAAVMLNGCVGGAVHDAILLAFAIIIFAALSCGLVIDAVVNKSGEYKAGDRGSLAARRRLTHRDLVLGAPWI